jgi:hypothetical protein
METEKKNEMTHMMKEREKEKIRYKYWNAEREKYKSLKERFKEKKEKYK